MKLWVKIMPWGEFSWANKNPLPQARDRGTTFEELEPYVSFVDHMEEIGETDGNEGSSTQVSMRTSLVREKGKVKSSHDVPQNRKRAKMALGDQISNIASSIVYLVTAIQDRNSVCLKKLLEAMKEVGEFNEVIIDNVYDFLVINEPQAKAFVVRSVEERKRWILRFLDRVH
ncbi:hypothetical protein NE237_017620 [Protea cynaroides]|uniref:Uncharacterized protein n=1 Tax=Protea cynaroides TaxID=273540 RepID=A0A9Q0K8C0_9MAGN|nr:hypothetical protein NE237_017620 [Protea cynaroides]